MLKAIALLGLGAAVAFTLLPAIAQTNQSAAPAASAKQPHSPIDAEICATWAAFRA